MILRWSPCLAVAIGLVFTPPASALASDDAAYAYRGLTPGKSTFDTVIQRLGPAPIETQSNDDLRYPVVGSPGLSDRLYFRDGKLAMVTAASVDGRYQTREEVELQFGRAEAEVRFQSQEYLDYSTLGLKFICETDGKITGVIYFPPTRRRVPEGHPSARIDLRRNLPPVPAAKAPAGFRVGAAEASIAPESFDNLLADGAGRQLYLAEDVKARVAVFSTDDTTIAIIGLDVFGLGPWDITKLRQQVRNCGCDDVVIAMSHTHANVDTIGFYGYYPREYVKHILEQTQQAVSRAVRSMQPVGRIEMGTTEMPLAGGRVVDLVRNGRDPGLIEPTVSLIRVYDTRGKTIVNLVHLVCHPEVIKLENTHGLSPDFVGSLCRDVTQMLGGQTVFLNGALGGMATPDTRFRTQQSAVEMGQKLAKYVLAAAGRAEVTSSYDLWLFRRPVEYPITSQALLTFLQNAPEPVDLVDGRMRTEMNVLWIGDAQLITVPGELLPDIGLAITSRMTGRLRCIVGLANDELGYLVPAFDFRVGHYEERTGPGPDGGPITRRVGLQLAPLVPPRRRK